LIAQRVGRGGIGCQRSDHVTHSLRRVEVALREKDRDTKLLPWIDKGNFNPSYMLCGVHLLPKRGDKPEWAHTQDSRNEKKAFPAIDLDDEAFIDGCSEGGAALVDVAP
jgi:hypothetical protein